MKIGAGLKGMKNLSIWYFKRCCDMISANLERILIMRSKIDHMINMRTMKYGVCCSKIEQALKKRPKTGLFFIGMKIAQ
jgi:hypothetical protein